MKKDGKNKRIFKRGFLQLSVRCTLNRKALKGYMTNLSEGGCLIYCYSPDPIPMDAIARLTFNLKKSTDDIVVKGRVIRVMPFIRSGKDINYAVGVHFLELKKEHRKLIFNFIQKVLTDIREVQTVNG